VSYLALGVELYGVSNWAKIKERFGREIGERDRMGTEISGGRSKNKRGARP
jgi:hypothetical protein